MEELTTLYALHRKAKKIYDEYDQLKRDTDSEIQKREREIATINEQITKLKRTFNETGEEILERYRMAHSKELDAKETILKVFCSYNIYTIGPVLAYLATQIMGVEIAFEIKHEYTSCCLGSHLIHYYRDIATLTKSGRIKSVFAESLPPKEISYTRDSKDMATSTSFNPNEETKLAWFDCDTSSFIYLPLMRQYINNEEVPDYIQDFICYVSGYRLDNNLKTIDATQLRELTDKFLQEHKEQYTKATTPKPHVITPTRNLEDITSTMVTYNKRKKKHQPQ